MNRLPPPLLPEAKATRREHRAAVEDWRGTPILSERRVAWRAPWFWRVFDRRKKK